MLKKPIIACVLMLAATAAMGWVRLAPVPSKAHIDTTSRLVWGDGMVWGLFPSSNGTFLFSYDPTKDSLNPVNDSSKRAELTRDSLCPWDTTIPEMAVGFTKATSLTFEPLTEPGQPGVLWAVGKNGGSYLWHYSQSEGAWGSQSIDSFSLDHGASIAYAPNASYDIYHNPTTGWIYCLPGGDSSFWRHPVPATLGLGLPDTALYGYLYPDTGATISDPTPPFRWSPAMTTQYRIQVSTDPNFGMVGTVIDQVVTTNQCQPTTPIPHDTTYYWRVATWNQGGGGSWAWPAIHYWFVLSSSWAEVSYITDKAKGGAQLAYAAPNDSWYDFRDPSIIAMYGDLKRQFWSYDMLSNAWTRLDSTPHPVREGSSLTTTALVEGAWPFHMDASFNGEEPNDSGNQDPYYYCPDSSAGHRWVDFNQLNGDSAFSSPFPEKLDVGSSMVAGADHYGYLTTGKAHDHHFFGLEPRAIFGNDGPFARVIPGDRGKAQVITVSDGVEVQYQLPAVARVRATLHDAVGRQVGMLDLGAQNAGIHRLSWHRNLEGRKLSAGAYFVLLDMGKEQARLKAVVR